jgi:hypothetical protein
MEYNPNKREPISSWLLKHIESLIFNYDDNVSTVLYAAFEARNLLEKIEYDLIKMSNDPSEWETIKDIARGKLGIDKANKTYKTLKYRYSSFSEALSKVDLEFDLKLFDYKGCDYYQSELSQYIHIYYREPEEMSYESEFIQNGISLIKEVVDFIKNYWTKDKDDNYVFGTVMFNTLNGSIKDEFEKWKNSVSEDTEGLYQKLKEINEKESGGKKAVEIPFPTTEN